MIKLLTFFSVLVFSTVSVAQMNPQPNPMPDPIEVEIYANLHIEKECRTVGDMNLCDAMTSIMLGSVKIRLYPQSQVYCPDNGLCDDDVSATSYRGLWSQVVENDSYRAIAIISIDQDNYDIGGETSTTFTITAEIIDAQGTSGKMVSTINSLGNLNRNSLYGQQSNHRGNKYTPILTIGRPLTLCRIGDTCNDDLVKTNDESKENIWNVEFGTVL